ncbi:hypothetical protein PAQ31011_05138 [Pandoraea aquatica]|uniref:DUF7673 domain-containing protein n=1 Tax=Pandoraea aquatica TaxID=2508290 RepID=A0A5E4Z8V7_9BURK|nr:hypothetical protein [Pandoraea aquatica]VVE56750.1 hypothetical protein PAQ31011_05138 [Pandoraea aquatica]
MASRLIEDSPEDQRRAQAEWEREIREASERRDTDYDAGLPALKRLFDIAHGNSGQCRKVAAFLLGLYNGQRFPFDMTDLRSVDQEIFEDMLLVLRMDSCPRAEVHTYFANGGRAFEQLANDWQLHTSAWEPTDKGMSRQRDGYMCFIEPTTTDGQLGWRWLIQSGGGLAWRGGNEITRVAEGQIYSASYGARYAKEAIDQWFERGGETPHRDEV